MGGNVLDHLPHAGGFAQRAAPGILGMADVLGVIGGGTGQVSGNPLVEHVAAHGVSRGIAKRADPRAQVRHAALVGQNRAGFERGFPGGPSSPCMRIVAPSGSWSSAVRMTFIVSTSIRPISRIGSRRHGIREPSRPPNPQCICASSDVRWPHRSCRPNRRRTCRRRGGAARNRDHALEPVVGGEHVVVDHVHDHFDAGRVQ